LNEGYIHGCLTYLEDNDQQFSYHHQTYDIEEGNDLLHNKIKIYIVPYKVMMLNFYRTPDSKLHCYNFFDDG